MSANGWLQLAIYLVVLLLLVKPLGLYMAGVFEGTGAVTRWFGPIERGALSAMPGRCRQCR